jgi:hypothetical protein
MLTQLVRSSEARKIEIDDVSMTVTPRFAQTGSIVADTVESRLIDIETSLAVSSSAPRDEIAKLVATAERMCFLIDAVRNPHEVRAKLILNGEPVDSS